MKAPNLLVTAICLGLWLHYTGRRIGRSIRRHHAFLFGRREISIAATHGIAKMPR